MTNEWLGSRFQNDCQLPSQSIPGSSPIYPVANPSQFQIMKRLSKRLRASPLCKIPKHMWSRENGIQSCPVIRHIIEWCSRWNCWSAGRKSVSEASNARNLEVPAWVLRWSVQWAAGAPCVCLTKTQSSQHHRLTKMSSNTNNIDHFEFGLKLIPIACVIVSIPMRNFWCQEIFKRGCGRCTH